MDHINGVVLIGHGPDYINGRSTVQHGIWLPVMAGGKSYAQKNVLNCQKTNELTKRLPNVTRDARLAFEAVGKPPHNGIVNPAQICCVLSWLQSTRVFACDEIVDNPKLRAQLLHYLPVLQRTSSCHLLSFPWASYFSPSYWKRQYGRNGMKNLVTPIVTKRMKYGADRVDDALQNFIDNGDSADYIINYLLSMIFIAGANPCVVSGAMLYCIAHHPEWQEKIYSEIKTVAKAHSKNKDAPLVDQLDTLPVQAWKTCRSRLSSATRNASACGLLSPWAASTRVTPTSRSPALTRLFPLEGWSLITQLMYTTTRNYTRNL